MSTQWIDGRPVSTAEAVRAAAEHLAASRLPVLTGDFNDISAIRAGLRVAALAGGVVDHEGLEAIRPAIEAIRDAGIVMGAPAEIRRRADRVLVIGPDPFEGQDALFEQIFAVAPDIGARTKGKTREIVWLGASEPQRFAKASGEARSIGCPAAELTEAVGIVRAALAGRRFADGPFEPGGARALAGWLVDAGFGAVVFKADAFDAIGFEEIAGLVSDLNARTRATALPVFAGSAFGSAQAATWATGFPMRVSFGRGAPDHDMELFKADRLIGSGEAEAVLLVAAGEGRAGVSSDAATILLSTEEPPAGSSVKVAFRIGRPGVDHDQVALEPRFGSFVAHAASAPDPDAPSSAALILSMIADHLAEMAAEKGAAA
ncbi:hypothetical protein [Fulvimarina manganoxydans]|uniref:hypothetical protein n=1 Tax=Fulvimarina manganoxydans TaxID=937218 RepID=UPI00111C8E33|nr:hypothetical protein [Fulvimarina manganoxydans]